jgi:hypothetical protein
VAACCNDSGSILVPVRLTTADRVTTLAVAQFVFGGIVPPPPTARQQCSARNVQQISRGAAQANSHGLQPVVVKKDILEAPKERRRLTITNAFAPRGLRRSFVDILPGLKSRAIRLHRCAV